MKGLRRALITLGVVLVLAAAGLGVFLATFDIQKYRPMLQEQLSKAMGAPVTMGRVSLGWKNGLAIRLENVSVFMDEARSERLLHLKGLSATVRLASLLAKQVNIASLYLDRPSLRLIKLADGTMLLPSPKTSSETGPRAESASSPTKAPSLMLDVIGIDQGEIIFEDRTAGPGATLVVDKIDLRARQVSLDKPFGFELAMALFSDKQNIEAEGRLALPKEGDPAKLTSLHMVTGLADWDIERLARWVPGLSVLEGNVGGRLELEASEMPLEAQALARAAARLTMKNVAFKLTDAPFPVEKLQAVIDLKGEDLTVETLSAELAGGTVRAEGEVMSFRTQPRTRFAVQAQGLSIEALSGSSQGRRFGGALSAEIQASAQGTGAVMAKTLTGQGRLSVADGVFYDLNLLREVVGKTSMIPGAEGVLERELPAAYRAKMAEPDTHFSPIELPFRLDAGRLVFDQFQVSTEFIRLQGRGWMGLERSFGAQTVLQVHPTLSRIMAQIVSPIQLLFNRSGEAEAPIHFSGRLPHVKVTPDMQYLTQRLLTAQAQQLLTGFVKEPGKGLGKMGNIFDSQLSGSEAGFKNLLLKAIGGQAAPTTGSEGQTQ